MAAVLSESPKPLPNKEPSPEVSLGSSFSSAALGSALNVVPRTKGDDSKVGADSFLAFGGGNAVSVSINASDVLEAKPPDGFDPKMLVVPVEAPPREPNPPLLAKFAKPPDDGEVGAPLPKILPAAGAALAKLV